jgi:pimeloyl-ACP methyl ester carboxylesterase
MRQLLVLLAAAAAGLVAAGAGADASRPAASARCASGSTAAVIGGKKVCLKAGQKCDRRKDRQYHKYKFHCHTGRLARFPKPKPPPPPPPPSLPGLKVDVGGYKLYIDCIGSGSPTVILEPGTATAGATGTLAGWEALRTSIGAETRVCAYDRAGLGASDKRPAGVAPTGARFAEELHALLAGANVPGPYVLVGASYGGLIVAAHQLRYPDDYVGFVFLDADKPCPAQCAFEEGEPGIFDVASVDYGNRPVVVVTTLFLQPAGPDIARRSTNSILADSPLDGHNLPASNPGLTGDAVGLVIAAVRAGTHLPPCEQTTLPARGASCMAVGP